MNKHKVPIPPDIGGLAQKSLGPVTWFDWVFFTVILVGGGVAIVLLP